MWRFCPYMIRFFEGALLKSEEVVGLVSKEIFASLGCVSGAFRLTGGRCADDLSFTI